MVIYQITKIFVKVPLGEKGKELKIYTLKKLILEKKVLKLIYRANGEKSKRDANYRFSVSNTIMRIITIFSHLDVEKKGHRRESPADNWTWMCKQQKWKEKKKKKKKTLPAPKSVSRNNSALSIIYILIPFRIFVASFAGFFFHSSYSIHSLWLTFASIHHSFHSFISTRTNVHRTGTHHQNHV